MVSDAIMWSPGVTLDAIEKQVIYKAFSFYKQNKTATANALGISIKTLDNKFDRYNKEDESALEAQRDGEIRREEFLHRSRYGSGGGISNPLIPATASQPPMPQAEQGMGVESVEKVSRKRALPLPDGEKVQAVLPSEPPRRRHGAGRT